MITNQNRVKEASRKAITNTITTTKQQPTRHFGVDLTKGENVPVLPPGAVLKKANALPKSQATANVFQDVFQIAPVQQEQAQPRPASRQLGRGAVTVPMSFEIFQDIEEKEDRMEYHVVPMDISMNRENHTDIDEEDHDVIVCVTKYINDIMDHMKQKETSDPIPAGYVVHQREIRPEHMSLLFDWMQEAFIALNLLSETFALSIQTIRRVMSKHQITRRKLQLLALGSLLVASKFEEEWAPPIEDLRFSCDSAYETKEILKMEASILNAIDFNLTSPQPLHFYRRYSKAGRLESRPHTLGKFLTEISSLYDNLLAFRPSMIAAASVLLARHICGDTPDWDTTLTHYTGYTRTDLLGCAQALQSAYRTEFTKPQEKGAIFRHYAKSHLLSVSLIGYGTLLI